jgi:hypothetical protein
MLGKAEQRPDIYEGGMMGYNQLGFYWGENIILVVVATIINIFFSSVINYLHNRKTHGIIIFVSGRWNARAASSENAVNG